MAVVVAVDVHIAEHIRRHLIVALTLIQIHERLNQAPVEGIGFAERMLAVHKQHVEAGSSPAVEHLN